MTTQIVAYRSGKGFGREIRFSVHGYVPIPGEEGGYEARFHDCATFADAETFARELSAEYTLTLGGLGKAHATSRAGFPKRGPDSLTEEARAYLASYGFMEVQS